MHGLRPTLPADPVVRFETVVLEPDASGEEGTVRNPVCAPRMNMFFRYSSASLDLPKYAIADWQRMPITCLPHSLVNIVMVK